MRRHILAHILIYTATPFIAHLTELYKNRRIPLLLGQVALIASQVMLMEAPKFWVMVLARVAQGMSASVIWVVGLALVCVSARSVSPFKYDVDRSVVATPSRKPSSAVSLEPTKTPVSITNGCDTTT